MKKLRAEYKKVKDRHKETGQGRFPEWEFYDAMDDAIGHKHSTEPPVVIESMPNSSSKIPCLSEIGPDDETQDMSGSTEPVNMPSPVSSASLSSCNSSNADASNEDQHVDSKPKSRKLSKSEATNALLEKMVTMQEKNDVQT